MSLCGRCIDVSVCLSHYPQWPADIENHECINVTVWTLHWRVCVSVTLSTVTRWHRKPWKYRCHCVDVALTCLYVCLSHYPQWPADIQNHECINVTVDVALTCQYVCLSHYPQWPADIENHESIDVTVLMTLLSCIGLLSVCLSHPSQWRTNTQIQDCIDATVWMLLLSRIVVSITSFSVIH